mmetsp:Transcript_26162/g.66325  ORF Transcript_26162/g.66325 Transcript_26162/m.66325 type:complete len:226 (-) Transcript_26162:586-1263(-)
MGHGGADSLVLTAGHAPPDGRRPQHDGQQTVRAAAGGGCGHGHVDDGQHGQDRKQLGGPLTQGPANDASAQTSSEQLWVAWGLRGAAHLKFAVEAFSGAARIQQLRRKGVRDVQAAKREVGAGSSGVRASAGTLQPIAARRPFRQDLSASGPRGLEANALRDEAQRPPLALPPGRRRRLRRRRPVRRHREHSGHCAARMAAPTRGGRCCSTIAAASECLLRVRRL